MPTSELSGGAAAPHAGVMPQEVIACLEKARFLHLATCRDQEPHISLMSYTYLSQTPYSSRPTIIMTTPPASRKTDYLTANPKVSILVHDWVSNRPPTLNSTSPEALFSTSPEGRSSGLASLLYNLNSAALSRISVSINGIARLVEQGSEEESWYKALHKENNTFGDNVDTSDLLGTDDGAAGWCYIDGQEVRVVVVEIRDGRISDFKGLIKDWSLESTNSAGIDVPQVNGT